MKTFCWNISSFELEDELLKEIVFGLGKIIIKEDDEDLLFYVCFSLLSLVEDNRYFYEAK